jgi:hypothetical protein
VHTSPIVCNNLLHNAIPHCVYEGCGFISYSEDFDCDTFLKHDGLHLNRHGALHMVRCMFDVERLVEGDTVLKPKPGQNRQLLLNGHPSSRLTILCWTHYFKGPPNFLMECPSTYQIQFPLTWLIQCPLIQTYRQTDINTDRQTYRQTDRHTDRHDTAHLLLIVTRLHKVHNSKSIKQLTRTVIKQNMKNVRTKQTLFAAVIDLRIYWSVFLCVCMCEWQS